MAEHASAGGLVRYTGAPVTMAQRVTELLLAWGEGDHAALEQLIPLVHAELRRIARRYMAGERRGHTLQPTALVNEVYLRLVDLERVRWRDDAGRTEERDVRHVFVMTGALPSTDWLKGCVALDAKGFIKTGPDLTPEDLSAAQWPLTRLPHLLETSRPRVFAVGDVRAGNVKRVASAVGEGSIAIALVHQALHG